MTTSNRTLLSAILVTTTAALATLASGCAVDTASADPARTDPQADTVHQQSRLQPSLTAGNPLGGGAASPNAVINDCACLDFSQICDCRSGTCYGYVANGQDGPYACYEGSTYLYSYYCTHYDRVTGC